MDSHLPEKLLLFASIKNPLKMKKNVFYFLLKSLFVLKIFKFLSWLFWLCKKWLDEKTKVSKFMTSQTGILTITTRILSNFSWSKSSQTMKFILLIEYKMKNIFLEKSSPNSFYKNQNWAYRWINILKCYKFCFYDMPKSSSKCPSVQILTTCFYLTWIFLKNKERSELLYLSHFQYDFWRKIFLTLYAIKWLNLIAWLPLLLEILGNMCIIITCFPVCDVIKFEITFSFLIKPFSYDQNIRTTKRAFKMK